LRPVTKGVDQDDVTFFFLIEDTAQGAGMSEAQRKREMNAVNKAVQRAGGQCRLYETRGSTFEYVSVISGISTAAAIRVAREIDKTGNVKATLMPGLELFSGG
jgi:uncharacterized protein with GYD domain